MKENIRNTKSKDELSENVKENSGNAWIKKIYIPFLTYIEMAIISKTTWKK